MSYQKLNQVTRLFAFPVPLWDDAVQDIVTEANYFISVDMESGHCQVVVEYDSEEILPFFTPDGKRRYKLITMGGLKSAPKVVAMMMKLQI